MINKSKNKISIIIIGLGILLSLYICFYIKFFNIKTEKIKNFFLNRKEYSTLFGDMIVEESIMNDALVNSALLRMQKIDQGGPGKYFNFAFPFSRYDHCLGVWALIKRYGGSLQEQLVGLYHDISHTAFSHIADFLYTNDECKKHSYQDSIHLWYIENSDAINICRKYNIKVESLDPDNGSYKMLENDLPDMCADRIEYNLHTAYIYNMISKEEIEEILTHLHYDMVSYYKDGELITEKNWYFDDILHAKKFALFPLHFIKSIWNSPWSMVMYKIFVLLLKYAFNKKYITKNDFNFGTDLDILNKLNNVNDPYIIYMIDLMHNLFDFFEVVTNENTKFDMLCKGKFRGIDPLVYFNGAECAHRLTEVDFDFKVIFNLSKLDCEKGYKVKFKKPYLECDVIE